MSATTRAEPRSAPPDPPPGARGEAPRDIRLDLQGARGIGVSLVVVGHLFLWPSGVFAALDIFFVLSGYLITGILVKALGDHGLRYLSVFYAARARRLIPMAVLVLAATVVSTYLVYSGARARLVGEDAVWALFFAANWHFTREGTDYFATQVATPLQHYWSLSVEEQFYLVWPLLVLVALVLAARLGTPRARAGMLAAVLGSVTVASFGYSMWHSTHAPVAAYFSTFDRAWEFGAGGLLALAAPRLSSLPRRVRVALSWVGSLGLLWSIFLLDPNMPFPAPWGLLPVLLTGAIIVGGLGGDTRHLVLLHNPVMVYVGNISYSVYLWHMPVQLLLLPYFDGTTTAYYAAALLTTSALSVLSFHLLERPLRRARWLMTPEERRRRPARPVYGPIASKALSAASGWLIMGAALGVIFVAITVVRGSGDAGADAATDPPTAEVAEHRERLADALGATSFPAFDPTLDELAGATWEEAHARVACLDTDLADLGSCRFGPADATKTVAVVGDSFAVVWMPTVLDAFLPQGWAIQQLTLTQCPTWTLPSYVMRDTTPFPGCAAMHDRVAAYVAEQAPDLVILSSSYDQVLNASRPDLEGPADRLAERALGETLDRLARDGTEIVVLQPPPAHESLLECVTRSGSPQRCVSRPSEYWHDHVRGESAAAETAGARYLATEDWFCVDGRCPAFVGRTPVTTEGVHLTVEYARQLAGLLAAELLPAGSRGG